MNKELIKDLRENGKDLLHAGHIDPGLPDDGRLMDEAADALEAADKEIKLRNCRIKLRNKELDKAEQRLAELEWNYEAACNTLELRDKEIERLDAALAEIENNADILGWAPAAHIARKVRAGE